MPRVKVHHRRQITLPDEVRDALNVGEGDYLDIEVVDGGVLLRPSPTLSREEAWERLFALKRRIRPIPEQAAKRPEEQEEELAEEVKAMRRERHEGRP